MNPSTKKSFSILMWYVLESYAKKLVYILFILNSIGTTGNQYHLGQWKRLWKMKALVVISTQFKL